MQLFSSVSTVVLAYVVRLKLVTVEVMVSTFKKELLSFRLCSGTSKQHVANDYAKMVAKGVAACQVNN